MVKSLTDAMSELNALCTSCPKQGCCPRCVVNLTQEALPQFRDSLLPFANYIIDRLA
jgi:hypothetical protein